jgi:hypothetical protein
MPDDLSKRSSGVGVSSRSRAMTDRMSGRTAFERIALLLQGGGALGSYLAGLYKAHAEADLHPDWVAFGAGTFSIEGRRGIAASPTETSPASVERGFAAGRQDRPLPPGILAMIGLAPELTLARRARIIIVSVPTLVAWQIGAGCSLARA